MAVSATSLTSNIGTGASFFNTASISPTANRLVLLSIANLASTTPATPTVSGAGMTWVQVTSVTDSTPTRRNTLLRALSSSPGSGALTIDFGGQSQNTVHWAISEFSGVDTSGANGANALVQSATSSLTSSPNTSTASVTLSAFSNSDNATFGALRKSAGAASAITPGSGFTELNEPNDGSIYLQTEWKANNDTIVDWSFTNGTHTLLAIGAEIAAAQAPTVTTSAATNVSSTTATGNGTVVADGGSDVTERGVCWNTTGTPTTSDSKATSAGTTGAYTVSMTSLSSGTLYYARAYAVNALGTSYGSEVTFTTGGFTNPTNAYSSNNTYATTPGTSGIISIQLSGDAGATYSTALTKTYTSSEASQTYGTGSTELWGLSWLGSNVSDTNFRVKVGVDSIYQVYKTFGFAPSGGVLLTGIEISVEAKWDGTTTSIDHIKAKIYYGTSTTPVQAGSLAYATDGGDGSGALAAFDGSNWDEFATGTSPVKATGAEVDTGTNDTKFVTPKAINDSHNVPDVAPGSAGNVLKSDGTDWTSVTAATAMPALTGDVTTSAGSAATTIGAGKITNAMLSTTAGEIGAAWQNFTPSFTNWTIGTGGSAGTIAKYLQVGKTIFFRIQTVLGSSGQSVASGVRFSVPVTGQFTIEHPISMSVLLNDANGSQVGGVCYLNSATEATVKYMNAANTEERYGTITSTVPFTWAAGDSISMYGFYEAA